VAQRDLAPADRRPGEQAQCAPAHVERLGRAVGADEERRRVPAGADGERRVVGVEVETPRHGGHEPVSDPPPVVLAQDRLVEGPEQRLG